MKKKKIIYFIIVFFAISIISFFVFLHNSEILIENFNYKILKTEIQNNEMVLIKERHIRNNKIYGNNHLASKGIYIYYNLESSNPKYIIWNSYEIFTTNNEKIFWKKLNRDIPDKVSEQKFYLINFCSQDNTKNFDKFLERLKLQNDFEEIEVDFYCESAENENNLAYFNYRKYDSFVTIVNYDLCNCGSDGWIEFIDENNFINKLKITTNWFYY